MERKRYRDPSYVMVGFSRITSSPPGVSLFGSSVKHQSLVRLHVTEASIERDTNLSTDWYYGEKEILSVDLSPNQFAELLTTMNVGAGVPGTLSHLMGESYEYPNTIPSPAEQFKSEIDESLSDAIDELNSAEATAKELLDHSKPLNKEERKELLRSIERIKNWTRGHIPFILDQVHKSIQKSVVEAKSEIDSFVTDTILKTGIETLREKKPELIIGDGEQ
jgi:hypothetical protein